jgi:hypothetical protein
MRRSHSARDSAKARPILQAARGGRVSTTSPPARGTRSVMRRARAAAQDHRNVASDQNADHRPRICALFAFRHPIRGRVPPQGEKPLTAPWAVAGDSGFT